MILCVFMAVFFSLKEEAMCKISTITSGRLREDLWVRYFSSLVHKGTHFYLGLWAILAGVYEDIRGLFDKHRLARSYWKSILAE